MHQFIDSAYKKIEKIYSTEKGKNFIIHLIRAFLPMDLGNYYLSTDKKCAITGKMGFDVKKFTDMTSETTFLRAKVMIGTEEEKETAQKKLNEIFSKVREYFDTEEGENLQQTRRIYFSEKSDKTISAPALIALRDFAINKMLTGDRQIKYAINNERFKQSERFQELKPQEQKVLTKKSAGFSLGEAEKNIFDQLRNQLK